MHMILFILAGLACVGHAWREEASVDELRGSTPQAAGQVGAVNSAKALAALLAAFSPAHTQNPSARGVLAPTFSRAFVRSRPVTSLSDYDQQRTKTYDRASFLRTASALAFSSQFAQAAHAATTSATAEVTDKVELTWAVQVSAAEKKLYKMTIGLFGKDAPKAVSVFRDACAGTLVVQCPRVVDLNGLGTEKEKSIKRNFYKACLAKEEEPFTYAYSSVWSIQPGKRINAGEVDSNFQLRIAPTTPEFESLLLSHDQAGLISVKRGGGLFDFGITTAATPSDDETYAVIGRVLEGMESVQALEAIPVVKAAEIFKVDEPTRANQKVCEYGGKNSYCFQGKPLKSITLLKAKVL